MKRTNYIFLSDILKSIDFIERCTKGYDFDRFLKAETEQFAVVRNLEIIGEAARQIDYEFKQKHKDIPWRSINAFRNILIHEYFDVDIEAVWNVIVQELSPLKKALQKAILDVKPIS